ncbi:MmoB/DmpM family protein, partial [Nocardia farcinica]|uniref:MmoB/DmpM family protein n=1 Tax=Nocardia farcinica TaxID=37329 RepID=UPI00313E3827
HPHRRREEQLGRPFQMRELEVSKPSFVGRIETGTERVRFYLATHSTARKRRIRPSEYLITGPAHRDRRRPRARALASRV